MRRYLTLFCLSLILLLPACADGPPKTVTVVKVERVREAIPDALLTAPQRPAPLPATPRPTNRAMANWIADREAAADACYGNLDAIREIEMRRREAGR